MKKYFIGFVFGVIVAILGAWEMGRAVLGEELKTSFIENNCEIADEEALEDGRIAKYLTCIF